MRLGRELRLQAGDLGFEDGRAFVHLRVHLRLELGRLRVEQAPQRLELGLELVVMRADPLSSSASTACSRSTRR